jgi:hypothetical protein
VKPNLILPHLGQLSVLERNNLLMSSISQIEQAMLALARCESSLDYFFLFNKGVATSPMTQNPIANVPKEKIPNEKTPTETIPIENKPKAKIPEEKNPSETTPVLKKPTATHPSAAGWLGMSLGKGGWIRPTRSRIIASNPQARTVAVRRVMVIPSFYVVSRSRITSSNRFNHGVSEFQLTVAR